MRGGLNNGLADQQPVQQLNRSCIRNKGIRGYSLLPDDGGADGIRRLVCSRTAIIDLVSLNFIVMFSEDELR